MQPIRTIGLFEGIGGFIRGSELIGGFEWIESVELDNDAVQVLRTHYDHHTYHGDIRDYHPTPGADLYTIGFPCNNTSNAGDRTGLMGEQSGLWLEALRCIVEGLPQFVIIEQPEGILYRGLRAILGGLRMAGYQWDDPLLLPSACVGATQRRTRLFTIAYPDSWRWDNQEPSTGDSQVRSHCQKIRHNSRFPILERTHDGCNLRLPDGLDTMPIGVDAKTPDRIRSRFLYGRTVIPQQAAVALQRVKYLHDLRAGQAVA